MNLHAISTGTVMIRASQPNGTRGRGYIKLITLLRDSRWMPPLPINVWVIEHPEGIIVVDTGDNARAGKPGYFPWWHPFYRFGFKESIRPEDEIGPQLEKIGIAPNSVRWVVLTHTHTDHAGGLHHFPKAEIVLGRKEYDTTGGISGVINGFSRKHYPEWFNPHLIEFEPKPFSVFPESYTLTKAADVVLVPTPGHTDGHLSVILREGDKYIFFAGDTSYSEAHLLRRTIDGVTLNVKASRQTLDRINQFVRENPTVYLPTHDPDSAARLEERRVVTP